MVSAALCISTSGQTLSLLHGRGAEWLSWTPMQRTAYVQGLADGYMGGFLKACELADEVFEVGKRHRLGDKLHQSEIPSGRCLAHRGEFSEAKLDDKGQFDVGAYRDVITDFYEKHPMCRDFPFPLPLQTLGSEYASADQLYEKAVNGGLKEYPRSRQWCGGQNPDPKP
jgi:hypothetical protein